VRLALDTNVIAALLNGEPYAEAVAEVLEGQRRELLLICGQVYASSLPWKGAAGSTRLTSPA